MKLFKLFVLVVFAYNATAQIKVTVLDKSAIPSSIHYIGHIINSARYTDNEGEHIIITTETCEVQVKDEKGTPDGDFRKADLYAYDYKISGDKISLFWQIHDFTIECPVDLKASYLPDTFAITDLDKNGVAEVWLMYSTACRGDVSPANMKIIMHEGAKKYAMRGTNKVDVGNKHYMGGEYTFDNAFNKSLGVFTQYALLLWKKNVMEKW
ncbi:MAG: M949_RS01915 family surface polysaccharide biosynthesis protein [Mucilaginibacter sp.]